MGLMDEGIVTKCIHVKFDDKIWGSMNPVTLVDVVTGGQAKGTTQVKTCWDASTLYVRFECREDYAVSDFSNRDDPLYEQDVVEIFIDEEGAGHRYFELELSPNNVIFDAIIENDKGNITIHLDWDAEGLVTGVQLDGEIRFYELRLPFVNFQHAPDEGTTWRVNFYRINEDIQGKRHYQAWSSTGAVNYHIPSCFGTLLFVR
jgi:hypothetical protein